MKIKINYSFLLWVIIWVFCFSVGFFCNNPSNTSENQVPVYFYLTASGSATKIYCDGSLVSYLQYQFERDTILAPNGSTLKARIYSGGKFIYKLNTASDGLLWELP